MAKDYYEILGIKKEVGKDEIKKAFYKEAHKHHPDKNGGDDKKFKEINEAYQTLSDDKKRSQYDRFGSSGNMGGFGGGQGSPFEGFDFSNFGFGGNSSQNIHFDFQDLGDIFGSAFGFGGGGSNSRKKQRGEDLQRVVDISLEEVFSGVEKTINLNHTAKCKSCSGEGFRVGSKNIECKKCIGKGKIQTEKRTIFGSFASATICSDCEGLGKIPETKCLDCNGKGVNSIKENINIKIPKGVDSGEQLVMRGYGEAVKSGTSGDLYIAFRILPHKIFERKGLDLYTELEIKITEVLLGKSLELNVLGQKVNIQIPALSKITDEIFIKYKGLPHHSSSRVGDLIISLDIIMPRHLGNKEKELLESLQKLGM